MLRTNEDAELELEYFVLQNKRLQMIVDKQQEEINTLKQVIRKHSTVFGRTYGGPWCKCKECGALLYCKEDNLENSWINAEGHKPECPGYIKELDEPKGVK